MSPNIEAGTRATGRLQLLRHAEHGAHEGKRPHACGRGERRESSGDDDVVAVDGVNRVREGVEHASVPDRRDKMATLELRVEMEMEVLLEPQLLVPDARETT